MVHLFLTAFVTFMFTFVNIYQSFRPIALLKHMLMTNQCASFVGFHNGERFIFFIKLERKLLSVKRNLFIQVNICEKKKEAKFCKKTLHKSKPSCRI